MIEPSSDLVASDHGRRSLARLAMFGTVLALSACVSEADPRDPDPGPADARSTSDVRDADARDTARTDAPDVSVPEDGDDGGSVVDAIRDDAIDAARDISVGDGGGATDATGSDATDAMDVATDAPVVVDAIADIGTSDGDARVDAADAGSTVDVSDAGTPSDVTDTGTPSDASDAANDGDAIAADAMADVGADGDGADGGPVVFYQENFDTVLGTFTNPANVCATAVQWSVVGGYAHAAEPAATFVSRITSQAVPVPLNTSNITLRMSHKYDTEMAYDAAALLIAVNGGTATQVLTFTAGGYGTGTGGQTNPTTCGLTNTPSAFPGWSGNRAESISEVNLSAAPFNVVAGNTVTITFRMTTDSTIGGNGWDINWVNLSGTSP